MVGVVRVLSRFMNTVEMKKNVYFVAQVVMEEAAVTVLMINTNMVMGVNAYIVAQVQQVVVQTVHTVGAKNKTISILTCGESIPFLVEIFTSSPVSTSQTTLHNLPPPLNNSPDDGIYWVHLNQLNHIIPAK